MKHLYTFGYSGLDPAALPDMMPAGTLVADVRLKVWSGTREWSFETRRSVTGRGMEYLWIPKLGNLNYKNGGPILIADPEAIAPLVARLREEREVALMCACVRWDTCHRAVVADLIVKVMPEVEADHLMRGRRKPVDPPPDPQQMLDLGGPDD